MSELDPTPPERGDPLDYEDEGTSLGDYVALFLNNWKTLAATTLLAGLIGAYSAWTAPAVYTANALVQVEQQQQSGAAGESSFAYSPVMSSMSRVGAEIEILKSRAVASRAVAALEMTRVSAPDYLGEFGRAWARGQRPGRLGRSPLALFSDSAPETMNAGLGWWPASDAYAWGGEILQLDRLDVPPSLVGTAFHLIAGEDKTYRLCSTNGELILQGRVEKAATGTYRNNEVSAFVSKLVARPGTRFIVRRRNVPAAVAALTSGLTVREAGQNSGVLNLSLDAGSPDSAADQLNALTESFLKQNVERQSEEAKRTLDFLRDQLPKQKAEVDKFQNRLREYQASEGTVDLSQESQALLEQASEIEQRLSELQLKQAELLQVYTRESPQFESLQIQRRQLRQEKAEMQNTLGKLPKREARYLALSRDAQVANELYVQLLNRTQQLQVTKAGVTGFVRIIDQAYAPGAPSGPNRKSTVMLALFLGLLAGAGIIMVRQLLNRTLSDPSAIDKKLGLPVYATIPFSPHEQKLSKKRQRFGGGGMTLLASVRPHDTAIESVRSLRTSLQFAFLESENSLLSITSATPGCGKSFVAANLANLLAEAGKRVLLIDADMRLGHLHKQFGMTDFDPGLSSIISGKASIEDATRPVEEDKFDFIPSGVFPPNPSELLLNDSFAQLLKTCGERYDVVLLDTPPLLNVTDGVIVAKEAGTTFLVARAEHSTLHEVELAAQRLNQNRIRLAGVLFNGLKVGAARYGYGNYRYYGYEYKASRS